MFRFFVQSLHFTRLQSQIQKISKPHHARENRHLLRYDPFIRPNLNRTLQPTPYPKTPSDTSTKTPVDTTLDNT